MDPAIIKATQDSLGAIIKKPPLTEKLLTKPPFRFLHDVIAAVIKKTGFLDGLYSEAELKSENITDRDGKIAFLQKALDAVQFANNDPLFMRPSKTVAGQEPEQTNLLLQAIAVAINSNADSKSAVVRVLNGEKPDFTKGSNSSAGSNKENKLADASSKSKGSRKEKTESREPSNEKKEKGSEKKQSSKAHDKKKPEKERDKSTEKSRSHTTDRSQERRGSISKGKNESTTDTKDRASRVKNKTDIEKNDKHHIKAEKTTKERGEKKTSSKERSAKKETTKESGEKRSKSKEKDVKAKTSTKEKREKERRGSVKAENDKISANQKTLSPSSPAPSLNHDASSPNLSGRKEEENDAIESGQEEKPRRGKLSRGDSKSAAHERTPSEPISEDNIRKAQSATTRPGSALRRPGTGRPASAMGSRPSTARPPPPRVRKTVEVDSADRQGSAASKGESVTNLITQDIKNGDEDEADSFLVEETAADFNPALEINEGNDADVDVLEEDEHGGLVRKILETKKDLETGLSDQLQNDSSVPVNVFDEKERDKALREASQLQLSIQNLTRQTHPLGKLVEYLQEDVDSMVAELQRWQDEHSENWSQLRVQQGAVSAELEPMRSTLAELDQQVKEQYDLIAAVKANILANQKKIETTIGSLSKQ